jgi:hypothetical protein
MKAPFEMSRHGRNEFLLAAALLLVGLLQPIWAAAAPCCGGGGEDCCCSVEEEVSKGPTRSCCSDGVKSSDDREECPCGLRPTESLPVFPPFSLDEGVEGGERIVDWLASSAQASAVQLADVDFVTSGVGDRPPPRAGPPDAPRPAGALGRGLTTRLAELSVALL